MIKNGSSLIIVIVSVFTSSFLSALELTSNNFIYLNDLNLNSVQGCIDPNAVNYSSEATIQAQDDWNNILCIYDSCDDAPSEGCIYVNSFGVWNEHFGASECLSYGGTPCSGQLEGCMDEKATNYNSDATSQSKDEWGNILCVYASCEDVPHNGCMYVNTFSSWKQSFTAFECSAYGGTSCIFGCIDSTMSNYNQFANTSDNSCVTWQDYALQLEDEVFFENNPIEAFAECMEVVSETISLDLPKGWSMFGYTCLESVNVEMGLSEISSQIEIVKDESGSAYLPEWGFNGVGNFQFAEGYQIKMREKVNGFQFCSTLSLAKEGDYNFKAGKDYLLKNNIPFQVKGVVYVPAYPGNNPMLNEFNETEQLKNSIYTDLLNIKAMGANTVRFWTAPDYCYEALQSVGDLFILQTIWIPGDADDFHEAQFKESVKEDIREYVDRIYSLSIDNNPPLLGFILGNELYESSILSTDAAHPEINHYNGRYITTDIGITPTEAFLAEMADYLKIYEFENYGKVSLVSYANEIRTIDILDTPFLDFRSHNAYTDVISWYRPNTSSGSFTRTIFQGYAEELKSRFPNVPLLFTETGLSVSPNAIHVGPPNYGYGGNTETEQATCLLQQIDDINSAELPIAGVCFHEYMDAWWKFGLEDSYSQDPEDVQEWFGLVRTKQFGNWYQTEFRPSYLGIQGKWRD